MDAESELQIDQRRKWWEKQRGRWMILKRKKFYGPCNNTFRYKHLLFDSLDFQTTLMGHVNGPLGAFRRCPKWVSCSQKSTGVFFCQRSAGRLSWTTVPQRRVAKPELTRTYPCRKGWNDAFVVSPFYIWWRHGVIEHSQLELKLDNDPGFFWKNIESDWMQWLELSYEFPSNSSPRQRLKLHHLERPWVRRRACSLLALLMSRARHLSQRNQNVADLHNSLADLKIGVFIQVDEF